MKGQKGITLIALILTVLVLIILVAVAIYSIENHKIIAYTESAKTDFVTEQNKENQLVGEYNSFVDGVQGGSNSGSDNNNENTQQYSVYATLVAYGDPEETIKFSTDNGTTWTDIASLVGHTDKTKEETFTGKFTLSSNVSQIKFKISAGSASVKSVGYEGISDVYSLNQSVNAGGLETENIALTQDMYVELRVSYMTGPWLPID